MVTPEIRSLVYKEHKITDGCRTYHWLYSCSLGVNEVIDQARLQSNCLHLWHQEATQSNVYVPSTSDVMLNPGARKVTRSPQSGLLQNQSDVVTVGSWVALLVTEDILSPWPRPLSTPNSLHSSRQVNVPWGSREYSQLSGLKIAVSTYLPSRARAPKLSLSITFEPTWPLTFEVDVYLVRCVSWQANPQELVFYTFVIAPDVKGRKLSLIRL